MKFATLLNAPAVVIIAAQAGPSIVWAQAEPAPPIYGVLGKIQSLTGSSLDVATAKLKDYLSFCDSLTGLKKPARISDVIASGSGSI